MAQEFGSCTSFAFPFICEIFEVEIRGNLSTLNSKNPSCLIAPNPEKKVTRIPTSPLSDQEQYQRWDGSRSVKCYGVEVVGLYTEETSDTITTTTPTTTTTTTTSATITIIPSTTITITTITTTSTSNTTIASITTLTTTTTTTFNTITITTH
ncbi:Pdz Domain-Containing Protein 2 [Manis pentadactyla]|nr:Pdz Domain-Containing Protein 2 [Manis pentadactyla]